MKLLLFQFLPKTPDHHHINNTPFLSSRFPLLETYFRFFEPQTYSRYPRLSLLLRNFLVECFRGGPFQ